MTKISSSVIDSFHSYLMDDDQFNEAMMRVALQIAEEHTADEEDQYELAMDLCCRVSVA